MYSVLRNDPFKGSKLQSRPRQLLVTGLLLIVAFFCTLFTILFAYNSSIDRPFSKGLVLATPQRQIVALNVFSQLTVFVLGELITALFEALRWSFASSRFGISGFNFLALSRSTSILGILRLLQKNEPSSRSFMSGHRQWGTQR